MTPYSSRLACRRYQDNGDRASGYSGAFTSSLMALFLTGVSFVLGSCGQQASEITPAIGPETHRQFLNMIGESFATNWPIGGIQDPTNVSGGEIRALGMHLTRESMNPKQFGKEYNDLIMP